ncbi:hypothetical protein [Kitasatospora sp. NPDC085879]|uniref:hypothetical protein n=1 Tax=Kitasatospora sp. NPDC085879 TaxID=3154769 RepID=UPI00343EEBED
MPRGRAPGAWIRSPRSATATSTGSSPVHRTRQPGEILATDGHRHAAREETSETPAEAVNGLLDATARHAAQADTRPAR